LSRPIDWAPLAVKDPLAGDPEEIEQVARHLHDTVAELTWQVNTLKGIGADGHLTGAYADALRSNATDVAAKLEKVISRYTETAQCLTLWAPELHEFQLRTERLLTQAQEIERAAGRDIHADLLTPQQLAYRRLYATGPDDTPAGLEALSKQLQAVLHEAEDRGKYWAHKISEAIDDQLTDGFWDRVHGWVENHKEQLEKYTSRLGWVATVAAIGALAVPGLNVAVLGVGLLDAVAIGSTGTLLATHTLMAAEGQGSWWEVGIDAVALATGNDWRHLGKGIEQAAAVTKEAGAQAAGQEAAERFTAMTRERAATVLRDSKDPAERRLARSALKTLDQDAAQIRIDAAQAAREAPQAEANLGTRLLAGSEEDANALSNANRILAEHPGNEAVRDSAAEVRRLAAKGRKNWFVAAGLDGSDKALNHYWAGSYRGFKEHTTHGVGWLQ